MATESVSRVGESVGEATKLDEMAHERREGRGGGAREERQLRYVRAAAGLLTDEARGRVLAAQG